MYACMYVCYVTQGESVAKHFYNCQYYVAISRVVFQEAIKILTGIAKFQGIGGYVCDNVV